MTAIPHADLERMLNAFDELVASTEAYSAFVDVGVGELEQRGANERTVNRWRYQRTQLADLVTFLEEDVLDRLRELVDRTAGMEAARRDDFV